MRYRGRVFFNNEKRLFNGKPAKFSFLVYVYECRNYTGKNIEGSWINREGNRAEWVEDSKLLTLPMEEGDSKILEWIAEEREFNKEIRYNGTNIEAFDCLEPKAV